MSLSIFVKIRENEEKGIVLGRSDELLYIARLHSAESENYVLEWSRCRGTRFMKFVMQPVIQGIYIFIPLEITGCCFHEAVIIPGNKAHFDKTHIVHWANNTIPLCHKEIN